MLFRSQHRPPPPGGHLHHRGRPDRTDRRAGKGVSEVALSVSPPCGRLASSPEGGAKCTAVKPGKRRVRRSCAPLSFSPPCGRLASSPAGGAKRTDVKPGERVVRQSRREVRLTTTWPTPTGVLLPPPVGHMRTLKKRRRIKAETGCACAWNWHTRRQAVLKWCRTDSAGSIVRYSL